MIKKIPFHRIKLLVEKFDTTSFEPTNQNSIKLAKGCDPVTFI